MGAPPSSPPSVPSSRPPSGEVADCMTEREAESALVGAENEDWGGAALCVTTGADFPLHHVPPYLYYQCLLPVRPLGVDLPVRPPEGCGTAASNSSGVTLTRRWQHRS